MTADRARRSKVAGLALSAYERSHAARSEAQRVAFLSAPPKRRTTLPGEAVRRPRWLLRAGLLVAGLAFVCSAIARWGIW